MKVSIITVIYNNKNYIAECIQSVLSQDYPDIEYIVVDGGSTDGTRDIINSFRNKINCYISEKDKSLYNALNKGIKKATGDIIGILHSDDTFYNESTVRDVVSVFQQSGSDLVYANGLYIGRRDPSKIKRIYESEPFKQRYLYFGWIPLHTTIYVKKDVFDKYGLYDEKYSIAGDYDISLRWFKNGSIKKVFFNKIVVKMRFGGLSTLVRLQIKKSTEDYSIIKKHNLWGLFTLFCKISRKIPQYIKPKCILLKKDIEK